MLAPSTSVDQPTCDKDRRDNHDLDCFHDGWHHAENFEEVARSLSLDLDVYAADGDPIISVEPWADPQWHVTCRLVGGSDWSYYSMDPDPFLVQDAIEDFDDEWDGTMFLDPESALEKLRHNHRNTN